MRPSVKTCSFTSNENGINTYIFYDFNSQRYMVQFSWQTSRPNKHFFKRIVPLNYRILNYYPLDHCYDWSYDYQTNSIRLRLCKYCDVSNAVRKIVKEDNMPIDNYMTMDKSPIGMRNLKALAALNKICHFTFILDPNKLNDYVLKTDMRDLNNVIDYIHQQGDEKLFMGHYSPNVSPYTLNSYGQDKLMELVGMGYCACNLMRKAVRASRIPREMKARE